MHKLSVMTIVGTRPEVIRLSRVMSTLEQYCHHILIHTGQNYDYELNDVFFEELGIRPPDIFLGVSGKTPAETIGNIIIEVDKVLEHYKPEALLILGDTNSSLAAIPAKRRKIPIFHMEAGNRCFDFRVPEEINRRIVDHIADINLPYSSHARDYLIREGFPADQIIKTGSPMKEVIDYYLPLVEKSEILKRMAVDSNRFLLVSAHREENVDSETRLLKLIGSINNLADSQELPVIFSTHPRTRSRLEEMKMNVHPSIVLSKPFGFIDYLKLQINARCVLSDSGTITEESSILNFPALNLREMHERPEGFEEGSVMMVGLDYDRILQGLSIVSSQRKGLDRDLNVVADYDAPNVSLKVLRIIQSYTDFINRKTWKKI